MSPTERLARRNGRKIAKLLQEVVNACRADGLEKPNLFFEPESRAIFVMNSEHPGDSGEHAGARQAAVVQRIDLGPIGCPFDAGAW